MLTLRYSTLAAISMLAILGADLIVRTNSFIGESNGSTAAVLALNTVASIILLFLARKTAWRALVPKPARVVFALLLAWGLLALVRGGLVASDYWAWKALLTNHVFMYLVPVALVLGLNPMHSRRVLLLMLCVVLPVSLAVIPFALRFDTELFQRAAMPLYLLVLLVPFVSRRWQLFILAMATISVFMDFSYRTNVMRICVAGLLAVAYMLLRVRFRPGAINGAWLVCLLAPLLFLGLGLTGRYNVFEKGLDFDAIVIAVNEGGQERSSQLNADTRTFLYEEVLASMKKRGSSFVVGQGAGTGYESRFFSRTIIGAAGRGGSEVGFLNTLLYSGVVGVVLYAAMLLLAAFYAFNRSNNDACKLMGLFLLFKWVLFFVEDIPKMDLNFFVTWMMVGLCLSSHFRQMDNVAMKEALRFRRSRKTSAASFLEGQLVP